MKLGEAELPEGRRSHWSLLSERSGLQHGALQRASVPLGPGPLCARVPALRVGAPVTRTSPCVPGGVSGACPQTFYFSLAVRVRLGLSRVFSGTCVRVRLGVRRLHVCTFTWLSRGLCGTRMCV